MNKFYFSFLILFLFSACSSQKTLYEDVKIHQDKAYDQWRICDKKTCGDEVFLDGKLSLEDALKISLQYNKKLQAVFQDKKIAKGKILEALSLALPHLKGSAAYTRMDTAPKLEVGNAKVTIGYQNNYSVDLNLRQPVFYAGQIAAGIEASKFFLLFSDERIRKQLQTTIFLTAQAYYHALLAARLYEVNIQTLKTANAHLQTVKDKKEQGLASSYDILRSEVEVSNFEAEKIKQENALHLAITHLLKTLGASQQSDILLSDELEYVPFAVELEQAVEVAFKNRPDLYSSDIAVKMQEDAVKVVKGEFYPHVDAFFFNRWGRPDPHTTSLDSWGRQWNFRVALEWPLFEGMRRIGKFKQEKAKLRQKQIEYKDVKETVIFDVQKAHLSLQDADQFVSTQRLDLQRAKKALEMAQAGYEEGIQTQVEVMDALSSLTRSQSLYYTALFQHSVAKLDLDYAMGFFHFDHFSGGEEITSSK